MPDHLKGEPHLVLQYGHDLPIPIPDLRVNEEGVSATLSFARTPSTTVIPWSAVYVVTAVDGRGVLYQEDIPSDVSVIAASSGEAPVDLDAAQLAGAGAGGAGDLAGGGAAADNARPTPPSRGLRAVPLTGPTDDGAAMNLEMVGGVPAHAIVPTRRRKRPQLRLIK